MSYIIQDWQTGDVVTAEKLNNMEWGIYQADSTKSFMLGVVESTVMIDDTETPAYVFGEGNTAQDVYNWYYGGLAVLVNATLPNGNQAVYTVSKIMIDQQTGQFVMVVPGLYADSAGAMCDANDKVYAPDGQTAFYKVIG